MIARSRTHACFGCAPLLVLLATHALWAQAAEPRRPQPVGDEAFAILAHFFDYDRDVPLAPRVVETVDSAAYVRYKIVFTGVAGDRVPGYLAVPKHGTPPYPTVLLVDGLGGSKDRWWRADSWPRGPLVTRGLLAAGFAVLALDAPNHGERSVDNDFEPAWELHTRPNRMREMIVRATVEQRRAIDYLATRPEVDTARIGVLGLSMGGMVAFYLAALEPRIDVAVAGLTPLAWIAPPLYISSYASRIRRAPFLMLMGRSDGFYTPDEARWNFNLIPSPTKSLVFYDTGHRLPSEYAVRAVDWFSTHLR